VSTRFHGVYPILPTAFDDDGAFDELSQRRLVDFMIAAGVHGLVTLANASEGYAVSDAERDQILRVVLDQAHGRLPVIVGVSHPSAKIAAERSRFAQDAGASGILSLPPFYGEWATDAGGVLAYFAALSTAVTIPLMVQDHPLSALPLPPALLARLAKEVENVRYFKIEVPRAPAKFADTLALAGERVLGIFGGMNGLLFVEELARGGCGTMPSGAMPEVFVAVYDAFTAGDRTRAEELFRHYLPLIYLENALGGRNLPKEVLHMGGILSSTHVRIPVPQSWDETTRHRLRELAQRYDLLALRYQPARAPSL
jgi:2-keto-3-deoxy-L-arabinonate dehydratase